MLKYCLFGSLYSATQFVYESMILTLEMAGKVESTGEVESFCEVEMTGEVDSFCEVERTGEVESICEVESTGEVESIEDW